MEQDNVKWKYNLESHIVYKPSVGSEITEQYPVSGKVDWKDKQEVEEANDFKIDYDNKGYSKDFIPPIFVAIPLKHFYCANDSKCPHQCELCKEVELKYNATQIIKQEQPHRKAYNSAKEMFNDIANGRDDEPDNQSQEQDDVTGGVWVKASEIKELDWPLCIKYDGGGAPFYTTVCSMEELQSHVSDFNTIDTIEYLDESALSPLLQQNIELKATIVDLDAAASASAELMVRVMELEEENGRLKEENKSDASI